ncbi:hypothetical protein CANCADRAFT_43259 [Tortispora caseinolytica NRRL Y-17796]|uniref:Uncharacterized protein n=1 Tax=Tortispora caseinolytica NRRL Y-17796 TaxID=767744 RepID=A0A1E4TLM9_9ASCO|nr:hypothetical protein CANCADRAFT_43259 [Tortispora caseinolytica NRRL Y-17796]
MGKAVTFIGLGVSIVLLSIAGFIAYSVFSHIKCNVSQRLAEQDDIRFKDGSISISVKGRSISEYASSTQRRIVEVFSRTKAPDFSNRYLATAHRKRDKTQELQQEMNERLKGQEHPSLY